MSPCGPFPIARFKLFVASHSDLRIRAERRVRALLRMQLPDAELEVIDILETPAAAREHRVLATPVLIRLEPQPEVRIIGALDNIHVVQDVLGLDNVPIEVDADRGLL